MNYSHLDNSFKITGMAKAIHWPAQYRDVILNEPDVNPSGAGLYCALRLGAQYFEHQYWVDGEVVDIRVNHLRVRKGRVVGSVEQYPLSDLPDKVYEALKTDLKTPEQVQAFLNQTYGQYVTQPVTMDTPISVVFYTLHPVIPEEMETEDDVRPTH
jgi:hypothetical protein